MRRSIFIFTLLLGFSSLSLAESTESVVRAFIALVKSGSAEKMADRVIYPFGSSDDAYIQNKSDFIRQYHAVFDSTMVRLILASSPAKDWMDMGWRGICLHNGEVWIDSDGMLLGVNHNAERLPVSLLAAKSSKTRPTDTVKATPASTKAQKEKEAKEKAEQEKKAMELRKLKEREAKELAEKAKREQEAREKEEAERLKAEQERRLAEERMAKEKAFVEYTLKAKREREMKEKAESEAKAKAAKEKALAEERAKQKAEEELKAKREREMKEKAETEAKAKAAKEKALAEERAKKEQKQKVAEAKRERERLAKEAILKSKRDREQKERAAEEKKAAEKVRKEAEKRAKKDAKRESPAKSGPSKADSLSATPSPSDVPHKEQPLASEAPLKLPEPAKVDTGRSGAKQQPSAVDASSDREVTPKSNFFLLTTKYRVNIHPIAEGKYRYTSWNVTKSTKDKPNIVLNSGSCMELGVGDLCFEFTNNQYVYQCYVWKNPATHAAPAEIIIYRNGREYAHLSAEVKWDEK